MTLINSLIFAVAVVGVLLAIYFLVSALVQRRRINRAPYGVDRQERRKAMWLTFVRSLGLFLFSLALWVYLAVVLDVSFMTAQAEPTATLAPLPTAAPATVTTGAIAPQPTATSTPLPAPATVAATVAATATTPPDIPTRTPTPEPTATNTPSPPTAIVNSPNGLYLRDAPAGANIIELISDQTELLLLPGEETVEEFTWRRVRTPAGNEGWVADAFLILPDETP